MRFLVALLVSFLSLPVFAKDSTIELVPERTILLAAAITGSIYDPMMKSFDTLAVTGDTIDMIISSPGGEVVVGSHIIDRMEQLKNEGVKFRCVVRDVAASMAFQILLHCNERYATPHSFLLWHPVRVFMQGVVTASIAQNLVVQLQQADDVALHDLRAYLNMPEDELLFHFQNETFHQAHNLISTAPKFFNKVTNDIINLHPQKVALDTATLGGFFDYNQVIYIHERFMSNKTSK